MKEITKRKELKSLIEKGEPFLIDFYADWCGPCKRLGTLLPKMEEEFDHVTFYKANVDIAKKLAAHFNVSTIPLVVVLYGENCENVIKVQDSTGVEVREALEKVPRQ